MQEPNQSRNGNRGCNGRKLTLVYSVQLVNLYMDFRVGTRLCVMTVILLHVIIDVSGV